jgi:Zn-finger nucleic acid-binding protein
MVMMICPNCLISLSYQKNTCHQCGYEIDKCPVSSQEFLPRIKSFSKPILLHKLNLKRPNKAKLTD